MVAQGIAGDLASIGKALGSLFNGGGFDKFFEYLVEGMGGIAVFLIIYSLMMFISKLTLFREPEHHKYAHMFGIGLAILGVINDSVYGFIINVLGGSLLMLFLALFVVFGLWIGLTTLSKNRHIASEGNSKAAAKDAVAKREEIKEINELKATTRLGLIESKAEENAESTAVELDKLTGDLVLLIEEMQGQLSHAAALQSKGESTKAIRQGILDRIGAYVSNLHKEHTLSNNLKSSVRSLESINFKELKLENDEDNETKRMTDLLKNVRGLESVEKENALIVNYVKRAYRLDETKNSLLKRMETLILEIEDNENKTKSLQSELTQSLESGNIAESSSVLGAIKVHLLKIKNDDKMLENEIKQVERITRQIKNFHNAERATLVSELKRTQKQVKQNSN